MASSSAEAAAAPVAPGELITIHSPDEWNIQIEEAIGANKLVVIDFTASWCPPCRLMDPFFADMAKKNPNVVFLKVDVDEMKIISREFTIEDLPTFMFIKGGKIKDWVVGAVKGELAKKLELHMA